MRHGFDGADVFRHVVASHSIAARGGADETAILIEEGDGDAIDLGFHGEGDFGFRQQLVQPRDELRHLGLVIRIVEALHPDEMLDLGEGLKRSAPDPPGGGIGVSQFRVRLLKLRQLAQQAVKLLVGNLRRGLGVVEIVVARELGPEVADAVVGITCGVGHRTILR